RQFLAYPLCRFGGAVEGLRHAVLGDDRDADNRVSGHALSLRHLYRRGVAVEQGLDESGDGVQGDCRFVAADLDVQAGGGDGAGVAYAAGDEGELVGGEVVEAEVDGDRGRGPVLLMETESDLVVGKKAGGDVPEDTHRIVSQCVSISWTT